MHELSIAVSIVDMALEEAESRGVRIDAVHLKVGPLSGVVVEALLSCYEVVCDDTPLKGSRLIIEELRCRRHYQDGSRPSGGIRSGGR